MDSGSGVDKTTATSPTTFNTAASSSLASDGGSTAVELANAGWSRESMERDWSGSESIARNSTQDILPYLYASHFLSRWGDRMWDFAVPLFMIQVWPDSLLLAALYGLTETASIAVFGVMVGNWVDKTPRLKVVQISLIVQNTSVIISSLMLVPLLGFPGSFTAYSFMVLVSIVNLCGTLASLAGLASNLVVERDWVVVIADPQAPDMLAQINSVMRRIDLSCKLLAPVLVGALMSGVSALSCAVMIALWNALSVVLEYWFLHSVYWAIPALQQKMALSGAAPGPSDIALASQGEYEQVPVDEGGPIVSSKTIESRYSLDKVYGGWKVYCKQEMVLAGVALALLYFTVLSFGSLMTAVLDWRGVPPYVLGLARAIAALMGILATVAYPALQAHLKTARTGLWSIWIQWSLLSLCATSVLVHSSAQASAMLIGGVSASRFGLWMFDLSVTQLMQEGIPEHERGVVGGVQSSLQAALEMSSYIMGMIISDPKMFWIPVIVSYGSVGLAGVLYAIYVRKTRGHLLHLDQLLRKLRHS